MEAATAVAALLHLVGVADWAKWMSLSLGWPRNDQSLTCNVQLQPDVVSQNVDYYYVHYDDDDGAATPAAAGDDDDDDVADVEDVWTAAATVVSREDFDCSVATPHCPRCQVGSGYWFSAAT